MHAFMPGASPPEVNTAIFLIFGKIYNQNKDMDIKREIPFGPYICIAAFLVSLYGDEIVNLYLNLFM